MPIAIYKQQNFNSAKALFFSVVNILFPILTDDLWELKKKKKCIVK